MEEECKVSKYSVKIFCLSDLLGSQYLFEISQSSLIVKNNENGVRIRCFEKWTRWTAPFFFRNEGGLSSLFCKNIDALLSY